MPPRSPEAQRFVPLQSATDVSWMQRQAQTREPRERAISAQENPGASRSLHFDLPPDEAHFCSATMMHHVLVQNARPKSASRSLSTPAARSRPVSRSRSTSSESRPASRNKGDRPWSAMPALQGLKPQPLKLLSAAELARMRASIEKSAINEIRSLEEKESAMALVAQQRSELLRRGGLGRGSSMKGNSDGKLASAYEPTDSNPLSGRCSANASVHCSSSSTLRGAPRQAIP